MEILARMHVRARLFVEPSEYESLLDRPYVIALPTERPPELFVGGLRAYAPFQGGHFSFPMLPNAPATMDTFLFLTPEDEDATIWRDVDLVLTDQGMVFAPLEPRSNG
jgi:hypothetical protein